MFCSAEWNAKNWNRIHFQVFLLLKVILRFETSMFLQLLYLGQAGLDIVVVDDLNC